MNYEKSLADNTALLQSFRLVGVVLFCWPSHGLVFGILRKQRHHLCECARSNAEGSFDNPGLCTDIAGDIKMAA